MSDRSKLLASPSSSVQGVRTQFLLLFAKWVTGMRAAWYRREGVGHGMNCLRIELDIAEVGQSIDSYFETFFITKVTRSDNNALRDTGSCGKTCRSRVNRASRMWVPDRLGDPFWYNFGRRDPAPDDHPCLTRALYSSQLAHHHHGCRYGTTLASLQGGHRRG